MNTKITALTQSKVLTSLAIFTLFVTIAILAPLFKNQFITGPIVNALLFLSVIYLGRTGGILISMLPSLFSGLVGLLVLPLLPFIPYIIASNIILVLVFNALRKKSFFAGVILASFLKFLFLVLSSSYFIKIFIQGGLPQKIVVMMAWPQLITALAGGLIAFLALKVFKKHAI